MSWTTQSHRAIYNFPSYKGWVPSLDLVNPAPDGLWDISNSQIENGKISVRGGWYKWGDAFNTLNGCYHFLQSGGTRQFMLGASPSSDANGPYCASYDGTTTTTFLRGLNDQKLSFTKQQKADGNDWLIVTNGYDRNLKWDSTNDAIELTGKNIFDAETDESWNVGTRAESWVQGTDTIYPRTGNNCIKLTATAGGSDTDYLPIGPTTQYENGGITYTNSSYRIGYTTLGGNNRKFAIRINTPASGLSFDKIMVYMKEVGDPATQVNLTIRNDVFSGWYYPGSTVIATANALTPTTTGYTTFTFSSPVTVNSPVWARFEFNSDPGAGGFEFRYNDGAQWGAYTDSVLWTPTRKDFYIKAWNSADTAVLDLDTGYNAADEIYLDFFVDDVTYLDVSDDIDSYIMFTENGGATNKYSFKDMGTLQDGWNTITIAKNDSSWTPSGSAWTVNEWNTVTRVTLYIKGVTSTVNVYFNTMYLRKTGVWETTGSKKRPPKAKYCEMAPNGDRLLLANTDSSLGDTSNSGPNYIWYSDAQDIDTFQTTSWIAFPQEITGLKSHGGVTHVFTEDEHYILIPTYSDAVPFQTQRVDGPGCVANRSVTDGYYKNQSGLYFLSKDGVYFTSGTQSVKISDAISTLWEPKHSATAKWYGNCFDELYWGNACGGYKDGKFYLAYTDVGETTNKSVLICDKEGNWTRQSLPFGIAQFIIYPTSTPTDDTYRLVGMSDTDYITVFHTERDEYTDLGTTAVTHYWQTPYIGQETGADLSWDTLFLWVKSDISQSTVLTINLFALEPGETNYANWEEDIATPQFTVTYTYTPTVYKWQRLKIPLRDETNNYYLRARAVSLKVYDDSDGMLDYIPEKIVCTPFNEELD